MEIRIIKIDGEFEIVELENGEQKVCPICIFPNNVKCGDVISVCIISE